MKPATTERIRDHAARAEAWKRYALREIGRAQGQAEEYHARWQDAEMYGIRAENEIRNEAIREMERDARDEARGAYEEGYRKGRDDSGEGGW